MGECSVKCYDFRGVQGRCRQASSAVVASFCRIPGSTNCKHWILSVIDEYLALLVLVPRVKWEQLDDHTQESMLGDIAHPELVKVRWCLRNHVEGFPRILSSLAGL